MSEEPGHPSLPPESDPSHPHSNSDGLDTPGVEKFWRLCFHYALSKCHKKDVAEEFAQEAYIWYFEKKWKSQVWQLWSYFVRCNFGVRGYAKWRYGMGRLRQSSYEKKLSGVYERPINFVEDFIPAMEGQSSIRLKCLNDREKMLVILLEAGFKTEEVEAAFGHSDQCLKKCLQSIRRKCAESPEVKAVVEKDTALLLCSSERYKFALKERRKSQPYLESVAVDVPLLDD